MRCAGRAVWAGLGLGLAAVVCASAALAQDAAETPKPTARKLAPDQAAEPRKALTAELRARWKKRAELEKAGKRDEALTLATETYQLARKGLGAKNAFTAFSARQVGNLLYAKGDARTAANYYLAELIGVSATASIDSEIYRAAANRLAGAYQTARRYADAEKLFRHILKGATRGPRSAKSEIAEAYFRRQLGRVLRRMGRPQDAEAAYRDAVALYERHITEPDFRVGLVLTDLAGVQRVQGKFQPAIDTYGRVVRIVRAVKGDDDVNLGIVLDNMGNVFREMGRMGEAEKVQRQAVEIFEAKLGDDHLTTALGRANLAVVFDQQARYREAEPLYQKALAVYRKRLRPSDPRIGVLLDNYAGFKRRTGDLPAARKLYDAALKSLTQAYPEDHPEVSKVLNNLALAEQRVGNLKRAEELMLRALAITEKTFGKDHYRSGIILGNIGDVRIGAKNYGGARTVLLRAVRVIEAAVGDDHEDLIPPLRLLAGLSLGIKEYDAALAYSRRAMRAEEGRLRRLRLDPEGPVLAHGGDSAFSGALYVLDRVRQAAPQRAEALAREAFEIAQRVSASAAALSVAQIGARLASGSADLAKLVRERQDLAKVWKRTNADLIAAVTRPDADRDRPAEARLRRARDQAVADLARLDADLGDRFPQFAKLGTPQPLTVADAQAGLTQDAVLIQFTRRANTLYAFAVTRDTYVWRKLPTTVRETVENVAAMRCGLDSAEWVGDVRPLRCLDLIGAMPDDGGVLPFPRERAHKLYMTLISPLADVIGNKRLIVVPDHILAKLPLQTLLAKPAGADVPLAKLTWLAKSHAVSVLPSVASLTTLTAAAKPRTTSRPYLAVANPLLTGATGDDFSAFKRQDCKPAKPAETETNLSVAALPGVKNAGGLVVRGGAVEAQSVRRLTPLADTADEVCDVARIFNTAADDVLLGSAATEARITAANDAGRLAEARILHFATHGLVTGEVRGLTEPALVLTPPAEAKPGDDGLLTASEVARLNLDADWVVLSACNTAAGDAPGAEALSGLARAFLYAGTRSLLVSHWPVQSAAAVRLVTDTVGRLTKEQGLSRDEALRRAMATLIDDDANALNAHPQIWAPFALVGSTAPLVTAAVKPVPQSAITATPLRKTVKPARTRAPRRRARRAVQRPKPPAVQPQDDWRTRVFSR